jgi:hypothetical protein
VGLSIDCAKFGAAFSATVALVDAKKDVTLKIGHALFYVA